MASRRAKNGGRGARRQARDTPWLEWTASGAGLMITLALVGALARDALDDGAMLPALHVETGTIGKHRGGFTVEIRARNESGATAAQVEIEGVLKQDGQTVETARMTFDYLPGHSIRAGGLFFTRDPRASEIAVRALGYVQP